MEDQLVLVSGARRSAEPAWIAYGGVPFKMPKQFFSDVLKVCVWGGGLCLWCHLKPTMPFLTHETSEPRVTLRRTQVHTLFLRPGATPRRETDTSVRRRQKVSVFSGHTSFLLSCRFSFVCVLAAIKGPRRPPPLLLLLRRLCSERELPIHA